jgi:carboxypeptidase C (cathepsin A)
MSQRVAWLRRVLVLMISAASLAPAVPQESHTAPVVQTTQPASRPCAIEAAEPTARTHHAITIAGQQLRYTAEAGFLHVGRETGKAQASMFYVAYVKEGEPAASRPVTFAFNGGPGAASVWLNLGGIGPKRLVLPDDGKALPGNITLVDNDFTWLPFTDLVFIDPIGSGYSHVASGADAGQFYGVHGDADSMSRFIRLYVSRFDCWTSPKYLAGESYGTTRAAVLATRLARLYGMNLKGLILLSSALDYETFVYTKANDLTYVLSLPTYTAVAWYHHKLTPELQQGLEHTLAQAERWALDEYGPALARGSSLPEAQRTRVAASLHRFTGLAEAFIERSNLRISSTQFAKELLRDEGRIVGILDGRVIGFPLDPTASSAGHDPSFIVGPFTAAMQAYLRNDLRFETDRKYVYLSFKANKSWNWGSTGEACVDVTEDLTKAMTENPALKVLAGMGYFDLTTSYLGQTYALDHLGLAPALQEHITIVRFPSGHQIYTEESSLKKLTAAAREFITAGP